MFRSLYSVIPASVRDDVCLSSNAKLIYMEIASLVQAEGYCWARNRHFSEMLGMSVRSIERYIKELEIRGHISRETVRDTRTNHVIERRIWIGNPRANSSNQLSKNYEENQQEKCYHDSENYAENDEKHIDPQDKSVSTPHDKSVSTLPTNLSVPSRQICQYPPDKSVVTLPTNLAEQIITMNNNNEYILCAQKNVLQNENDTSKNSKRKNSKSAKASKYSAQWKTERFEKLWKYYPIKKSKQRAIAAWDTLQPDDDLINQMAHALVYMSRHDEQWQRGFGIPYLSTWINQQRWTDAPFLHSDGKDNPVKHVEDDGVVEW